MIYLDNAATSFIKPVCVQQAVLNAMQSMASPGRGAYSQAMNAADIIYKCRVAAAELLNAPEPENVIFTSNASHSLNIAINSLVNRGDRVLMSGFEHNSVSRPLYESGAQVVVTGRKLFDKNAILEDFEEKIKNADIVVCTHVSNVFGFILPIYEIAELCAEKSVPLIIDASQSAGLININQDKLKAAFIAAPGHKGLFGPQGTGILLCNAETKPIIHGGSGSDSRLQQMPDYLPDRLEAGTHNVPGIAGLLAGINYVLENGTNTILAHETQMLELMIEKLLDSSYELFYGTDQSGVLSLRNREIDCEQIASILADNGICVRAGMHCAPTAHDSAGTLETGTVRFSFSPFVTSDQILYVCELLKSVSS